jgi:hypothetical protein
MIYILFIGYDMGLIAVYDMGLIAVYDIYIVYWI